MGHCGRRRLRCWDAPRSTRRGPRFGYMTTRNRSSRRPERRWETRRWTQPSRRTPRAGLEPGARVRQPLLMTTAVREERKVLTSVFADVVGSTALAERLDPEDVKLVV